MDAEPGEGPDGSSIKPVSSLLARFENINKSTDALSTSHNASPRSISPAPKPDKLRDFKPASEISASVPSTPTIPARPKPKLPTPTSSSEQVVEQSKPSAPPPLPTSRPPVSLKPQTQVLQPPSLNVQPPQSPPKKTTASFPGVDQTSLLTPVAATPPPAASNNNQNFKVPARPRTPTPILAPPRSPRPGGSQPPSPPPPRRSGEIRREMKPVPIPPASRQDKPRLPPVKQSSLSNSPVLNASYRSDISAETSPFNSPPSSTGSIEDQTPPELPARPRPKSYITAPARPMANMTSFEPPPMHHSIAERRDGANQGTGSPMRGALTPQLTGETRPALPRRPQQSEIGTQQMTMTVNKNMPQRSLTQRAAPSSSTHGLGAGSTPIAGKRVSSTPTTQPTLTSANTHGRSKTLDHRGTNYAADITPSESPVMITGKTSTASTIPSGVASTAKSEASGIITTYPDGSNTNRRPPYMRKGCYEIPTKYDPRVFDICGELLCTSGHLTRVWSIIDGDLLMSLAHTEGIKATAVAFKPAAAPHDEGKYVWIGLNSGELMEVELATQRITCSKPHVHGRFEIVKIYRHHNELWTLDEAGTFLVWGPDENGVPNISGTPTQSFKVPKSHTFSMVVGNELWHATGKELRVFLPTLQGRSQFQVLMRPLVAEGAGEITSGTTIKSRPGEVFFGHGDGKVSIFRTSDYTCTGVVSVSTWKINALAGVGTQLWAAFNLGKVCVYDVDQQPYVVLKEWQAHDGPIMKMKSDSSSAYSMDRVQVLSLGADNKVKIWDGLLQEDWLEEELKSKDTNYCDFEEIKALVLTWNAGAATPHSLRYSNDDSTFFQDLIQSSGSPEILIFGFQELVDLEDKRATAKRFFKTKKKDGPDQDHMSHQYRDWRDFLMKSLDDYMPADDLYYLLHTAPLVGLFTCVFVKASMRDRIRNLSAAEIKRGMGGLHGNKGAVAVRFQIDDSSLCFVNCHLAAGQSQANARHNDIAAILENGVFPSERDSDVRLDTYCGGGDGTLIIDHELCILNGDLNYRIDTMSRDTVVMAVKQKNLSKLLERDQLLVARRRNPAFRLRAFEELPITFAPTYKYDVGTDNYDTSEKRRSPAWCDRLLFRGRGRMQQLDYTRHEVRVSDHRPVSGSFRLWVKKVDPRARATVWMECQQGFEDIRQKELADEKLRYLMHVCGYDEASSRTHLKELAKSSRSPSKTREAA